MGTDNVYPEAALDVNRKTVQKIHIIGSIGSGKTTLARKLSEQLYLPHYELDNMVWERKKSGDVKKSARGRDNYLMSTIRKERWIIEGVQHGWVSAFFEKADLIVFLNTGCTKRKWRIIKRFIKQKLKMEQANYIPSFKIFQLLYQYNTVFEAETKPVILKMMSPYKDKSLITGNADEILRYLK